MRKFRHVQKTSKGRTLYFDPQSLNHNKRGKMFIGKSVTGEYWNTRIIFDLDLENHLSCPIADSSLVLVITALGHHWSWSSLCASNGRWGVARDPVEKEGGEPFLKEHWRPDRLLIQSKPDNYCLIWVQSSARCAHWKIQGNIDPSESDFCHQFFFSFDWNMMIWDVIDLLGLPGASRSPCCFLLAWSWNKWKSKYR